MKSEAPQCTSGRHSQTKRKSADGGGLYLQINPNGSKYWRMKYTFPGKEKKLSFSKYPDVSLANGRSRRVDARKIKVNEQDPGEVKKAEKIAKKLSIYFRRAENRRYCGK